MKTIEQWLNELPDGYRERALRNTPKHRLSLEDDFLPEALNKAFSWADSQEGRDFWYKVYEHYDTTPLPPLPKETE